MAISAMFPNLLRKGDTGHDETLRDTLWAVSLVRRQCVEEMLTKNTGMTQAIT